MAAPGAVPSPVLGAVDAAVPTAVSGTAPSVVTHALWEEAGHYGSGQPGKKCRLCGLLSRSAAQYCEGGGENRKLAQKDGCRAWGSSAFGKASKSEKQWHAAHPELKGKSLWIHAPTLAERSNIEQQSGTASTRRRKNGRARRRAGDAIPLPVPLGKRVRVEEPPWQLDKTNVRSERGKEQADARRMRAVRKYLVDFVKERGGVPAMNDALETQALMRCREMYPDVSVTRALLYDSLGIANPNERPPLPSRTATSPVITADDFTATTTATTLDIFKGPDPFLELGGDCPASMTRDVWLGHLATIRRRELAELEKEHERRRVEDLRRANVDKVMEQRDERWRKLVHDETAREREHSVSVQLIQTEYSNATAALVVHEKKIKELEAALAERQGKLTEVNEKIARLSKEQATVQDLMQDQTLQDLKDMYSQIYQSVYLRNMESREEKAKCERDCRNLEGDIRANRPVYEAVKAAQKAALKKKQEADVVERTKVALKNCEMLAVHPESKGAATPGATVSAAGP